jgi:hypothetical protein
MPAPAINLKNGSSEQKKSTKLLAWHGVAARRELLSRLLFTIAFLTTGLCLRHPYVRASRTISSLRLEGTYANRKCACNNFHLLKTETILVTCERLDAKVSVARQDFLSTVDKAVRPCPNVLIYTLYLFLGFAAA